MYEFKNEMPDKRLKRWVIDNGNKNSSFDQKQGQYMDSYELSNNPAYIIKELRREDDEFLLKAQYGENIPIQDIAHETQNFLNIAKLEKADFIPRTKVIIAKNKEGKETQYLLSKKIEGEPLRKEYGDRLPFNESDAKQITSIINKLIDIYIKSFDKKTNKGLTIEFIKMEDWIRDRKGKLFLVDLFPIYNFSPNKFKEWIMYFLKRELEYSEEKLIAIENKIENGLDQGAMEELRNRFKHLFNEK